MSTPSEVMPPVALVTGVSGFVGNRVARRLAAAGWAVHGIVRPSSEATEALRACASVHIYDGTAASLQSALNRTKPDLVIHLAAKVQHGPAVAEMEDVVTSNVLFPVQLLEAMLAIGCRKFLNTGTYAQHFIPHTYSPVDFYPATKQAFEDLLIYYHEVRHVSCVTLKLFDTYGPEDRRRKLISLLLEAARAGQSLDLSPGDQLIDLSHIDDIADAFAHAAEFLRGASEPLWDVSFVGGERYSLKQLATAIGEAIGRPVPVNFGGRPYRKREVMNPIEPALGVALVGWRPRRILAAEIPKMF